LYDFYISVAAVQADDFANFQNKIEKITENLRILRRTKAEGCCLHSRSNKTATMSPID
jgi:hypothetical protein